MIFVADKPGQLANQLIIHSNLYLFSKKHKIRFYNPSFHRYRKYFDRLESSIFDKTVYLLLNLIGRIGNRLKINSRLFSVHSIGYSTYYDLDDLNDNSPLHSTICLCMGWLYRTKKLSYQNREEITKLFCPEKSYLDSINTFMSGIREDNVLIIGIHIRRGDYAIFEGGKYFYSIETYKRIISDVTQLFPDKIIKFLLCSNDPESLKRIHESIDNSIIAPGHELVDLYCLSKCDYIVGPPSTYSIWASYYGNVPLYLVRNPEKRFQLDEFKIIDCF